MERRRLPHADLEGGSGSATSRSKLRRPMRRTWVVVLVVCSLFLTWMIVMPSKQNASLVVAEANLEIVHVTRASPTNFSRVISNPRVESTSPHESEKVSPRLVADLESQLREFKARGRVLETDQEAVRLSRRLQGVCRQLLKDEPHTQGTMSLQFPDVMISPGESKFRTLQFRLASLDLMPYAVYKFLQIINHWHGGSFHRNAGHVLQAQVANSQESLAFQEYHSQYPHVRYTLGFAGRPGGPAFYISTIDNTHNHGPASQGSSSEADSCFAEILLSSRSIVDAMQSQPGGEEPHGFIEAPENWIIIQNFTLS